MVEEVQDGQLAALLGLLAEGDLQLGLLRLIPLPVFLHVAALVMLDDCGLAHLVEASGGRLALRLRQVLIWALALWR